MDKNKEKKKTLTIASNFKKKKLILVLFQKIKIKSHFLFLTIKKILLNQKILEEAIYHQKQTQLIQEIKNLIVNS